MGEIDWNERISQIKKIRLYVADNTATFVNNLHLQLLYGSLNRQLLDFNEKKIDDIINEINIEIND